MAMIKSSMTKVCELRSFPSVLMKGTKKKKEEEQKKTPLIMLTMWPTVDTYPKGLPRLAAFTSSDHEFMIFRGFKRLHIRIMLRLEGNIAELEKALDRLDKEDSQNPSRQDQLLDQLEENLKKYGVSHVNKGGKNG